MSSSDLVHGYPMHYKYVYVPTDLSNKYRSKKYANGYIAKGLITTATSTSSYELNIKIEKIIILNVNKMTS